MPKLKSSKLQSTLELNIKDLIISLSLDPTNKKILVYQAKNPKIHKIPDHVKASLIALSRIKKDKVFMKEQLDHGSKLSVNNSKSAKT